MPRKIRPSPAVLDALPPNPAAPTSHPFHTWMPPKSSVSSLMYPSRDPVPYSIANLVPLTCRRGRGMERVRVRQLMESREGRREERYADVNGARSDLVDERAHNLRQPSCSPSTHGVRGEQGQTL